MLCQLGCSWITSPILTGLPPRQSTSRIAVSIRLIASTSVVEGDRETKPFAHDLRHYSIGDDSYILKIDDITLTPERPEPGKDLLIEASGTLKETVDVGSVADVIVKIGVVRLLHKQFDLCDELQKSDIEEKCPVQPGRLKVRGPLLCYRHVAAY